MNIEDAKKIAAICSTADISCASCSHELFAQLEEEFPEINWVFNFTPKFLENEDYITVKETSDE